MTISTISLDHAVKFDVAMDQCLERCSAHKKRAQLTLELIELSRERLAYSRALLVRTRRDWNERTTSNPTGRPPRIC
jgi:hypothetical protein